MPPAGEVGRCRPLKVTSNGVEIPAWCTHDLWGSKFDKSEALAQAVDKRSAPIDAIMMANRPCMARSKKYNHPDCKSNPPEDSP